MKKNILFSLPGNQALTEILTKQLAAELGIAEIRFFPDGESYIRIDSNVRNKTAILIDTLNEPNCKIVPLLFMAQTLKELGAAKIGLVTPYLPYMRQDKRFKAGEGITSKLFAQLLSNYIDSLITIDPHLHRIHHLSEIYTVPNISTMHATERIAQWIEHHVSNPVLIGPDEESRQWVSEIAGYNNLSFVVGKKQRIGDRQVSLSLPEIDNKGQSAVVVDDVIATGISMLEVLKQLQTQGFKNSICIAVHALFNKETEHQLLQVGAEKIVTCNTIVHPSNQIDISDLIVQGIIESC